ncbi:13786_t:CDS:2, partial [Dentiscutata heterogama]
DSSVIENDIDTIIINDDSDDECNLLSSANNSKDQMVISRESSFLDKMIISRENSFINANDNEIIVSQTREKGKGHSNPASCSYTFIEDSDQESYAPIEDLDQESYAPIEDLDQEIYIPIKDSNKE